MLLQAGYALGVPRSNCHRVSRVNEERWCDHKKNIYFRVAFSRQKRFAPRRI
jgi:hypothetical protein